MGPSSKGLEVKAEEVVSPKDLGGGGGRGVEFASLPSSFFKLTNCLGMPVAGYEKELCSLLRKL